ncbi:hypothetical protein [Mycobacterium sp. Marseille-P9652]|uniref:hypothetical protein n=1 Tax=Mycobacterium sp. Marseille-P9652 TaxID=2654950 RepID=UPI001E435DC4|nr:hypothetical protein [Mycobacterium sp. Marseille-P9652]
MMPRGRPSGHPVSARGRLRRRLCLLSAPPALVLVSAAAKVISVGVVGHWAATDFTHHDIEGLRRDVAWLRVVDVVDPGKTAFAAGDLNVLEGRLGDADDRFGESLSRTDQNRSCPVRINLLLVRETRGDLAARAGDAAGAERFYTAAVGVAAEAPPACFAGNADPDPDRRAVRDQAMPRLQQKLDALRHPPPPVAPPPGAPPAPPPAASPSPPSAPGTSADAGDQGSPGGFAPISPDRLPVVDNGTPPGHRLGPGDPLDRLRTLLDNANAYGDNQE